MNLLPKISNTKHMALDVYGDMYYVKWHRVPKVSYESRATTNEQMKWIGCFLGKVEALISILSSL